MQNLLHVAIWSLPTGVSGVDKSDLTSHRAADYLNVTGMLDYTERCRILEDVVKQSSDYWGPTPSGDQYGHYYLFLAPEYYFSKSSTKHVVGEVGSNLVYGMLLEISKRHPRFLLFPGTMSYSKPLLVEGNEAKSKRRYEKAVASVKKLGHVDHRQDDLKSLQGKKGFGKNEIQIVHNSVYVFYNGMKYFKYNKIDDAAEIGTEESKSGRLIYVPGTKAGLFGFFGMRFGIEICADHDAGQLRKQKASGLDVQIVLSASVTIKQPHAVLHEGGFLFHSDSSENPAAYQWKQGRLDRLTELGAGITVNLPGKKLTTQQDDLKKVAQAKSPSNPVMAQKLETKFLQEFQTKVGGKVHLFDCVLDRTD